MCFQKLIRHHKKKATQKSLIKFRIKKKEVTEIVQLYYDVKTLQTRLRQITKILLLQKLRYINLLDAPDHQTNPNYSRKTDAFGQHADLPIDTIVYGLTKQNN